MNPAEPDLPLTQAEPSAVKAGTVGLDPAKNVFLKSLPRTWFAVHAVDEAAEVIVRKGAAPAPGDAILIRRLAPGMIGMEACGRSHFGARSNVRFCVATACVIMGVLFDG